MLDEIISVGACFDIITPIASLVQDVAGGPSCGFGLPADAGFSGIEVKRTLAARGVEVWGLMVVDNTIIFRVRKAQAGWAKYILDQARVPILYAPAEAFSTSYYRSNRKKASADPLDRLFTSLDKMGRELFG